MGLWGGFAVKTCFSEPVLSEESLLEPRRALIVGALVGFCTTLGDGGTVLQGFAGIAGSDEPGSKFLCLKQF